MSTTLGSFMGLVEAERDHQADKFAGGDLSRLDIIDQTMNGPHDFVSYIAGYATKWFPGGFPPWNLDTYQAFQKSMVKVAALAYAGHKWAQYKIEAKTEAKDFDFGG